jgi:D-3-phosphoglycerate dehydrogenase
LKSGHIAGAALDVFPQEPLPPDSPLLGLKNIIMTPHLAASTVEAQQDVGTQIVEQMLDALRGYEFRNAINLPIVDAQLLQELRPFLNLAENWAACKLNWPKRPSSGLRLNSRGRYQHVQADYSGPA